MGGWLLLGRGLLFGRGFLIALLVLELVVGRGLDTHVRMLGAVGREGPLGRRLGPIERGKDSLRWGCAPLGRSFDLSAGALAGVASCTLDHGADTALPEVAVDDDRIDADLAVASVLGVDLLELLEARDHRHIWLGDASRVKGGEDVGVAAAMRQCGNRTDLGSWFGRGTE